MKAPRLYTADAVATFLRLCRDRQPRDLIAAQLGWSVRQVTFLRDHLKRRGHLHHPLPYRSRRQLRRPCPLAGRESEIADLSRRDYSARAIGELFGVTRSTAANFMDRNGLYALHRRRYRRGRLPVSLRALTQPGAIDEADVRLAERMWAQLEDVA